MDKITMAESKKKKSGSNKQNELYEEIYLDNFSFGENWKKFLRKLNSERVENAKKSLQDSTGMNSFKGQTFLDLGSGSGLFSLAAINLGCTKVVSVDTDKNSIVCAKFLRKKFRISSSKWIIINGSALDLSLAAKLPEKRFSIVYSWGVLHHTGNMKKALLNAGSLVKKNGMLFIAIYNDFKGIPFSSSTWKQIKKFYNKRGALAKWVMRSTYAWIIIVGLIVHRKNPIKYIQDYSKQATRGMDFFVDIADWMGGYPYEYAKPDEIVSFYKRIGFTLKKLKPTLREGCNEFIFVKNKS